MGTATRRLQILRACVTVRPLSHFSQGLPSFIVRDHDGAVILLSFRLPSLDVRRKPYSEKGWGIPKQQQKPVHPGIVATQVCCFYLFIC